MGAGSLLQDFHQLERRRIGDILLVSSLFDFYLFDDEALLYEQFTRVSSGAEALQLLRDGQRIDLVITTLHIEDMTPLRLAREVRESGFTNPIVLLAYDKRELADLLTHHGSGDFDRVFIWQGDVHLLNAIIRNLEDEWNVEHDTSRFGVQCILVNEDSIRYASYFLPLLYAEVLSHSARVVAESVNPAHRALRTRARPKILLSSTWERAMEYLGRYQEHVIGVITDAGFPRDGRHDARAGIDFTRAVKERLWDVPVLLQSTNPALAAEAADAGALFVHKRSPSLIEEVHCILRDYFAFGDFVFRDGDRIAGRASDLRTLEEQLRVVPDATLVHHASRNDFSNWFKARQEFELAEELRPRRVADYASVAELRADLIEKLRAHRTRRQRGMLAEFSAGAFDPASSFARTGGGSVGGKARGLAFVNTLLSMHALHDRDEGLSIEVPPGVVIATGVFDEFLELNEGLRAFALGGAPDEEIMQRFIDAPHFPAETVARLDEFLQLCGEPLAVRSSSLLEDSQFHPFAGVYQTYMIPGGDREALLVAIKRVYASTFYRAARAYIELTSLRVEDEKMGVIVQRMVGARHGPRFYPEVSGVARSYNFYPAGPQQPDDGIVSVALGLGKTIVEGGATVRFSPAHPDILEDSRGRSQRTFYALDVARAPTRATTIEDERIESHPLKTAEEDGTLHAVASTYSAENDALSDGISRAGTRIVTFAPLLRHRVIPLAAVLEELLKLGARGIGSPVEIEFAVNLRQKTLGVLQMRPLVLSREMDELVLDDIPAARLLCESTQVLGHGVIRDLRDIVVVDADTFERSRSHDAARALAAINARLVAEQRGYLLIGPGRWGSLDPLLGIPVKWDQISGARAIVEAGFRDVSVDPSQGSHFFQNLTAFQVGYFSVSDRVRGSFVDWEWLAAQRATSVGGLVRHVRLEHGVTVKMNARERRGVILKG